MGDSSKKVAYVIGPYRAPSEWAVKRNIEKAEAVAVELWRAGFAVICPHKNTAFFGGICDDAVWLEGDLEILSRCDFAVTVEGWENSQGSTSEVTKCQLKHIPVYHSTRQAIWTERDV